MYNKSLSGGARICSFAHKTIWINGDINGPTDKAETIYLILSKGLIGETDWQTDERKVFD